MRISDCNVFRNSTDLTSSMTGTTLRKQQQQFLSVFLTEMAPCSGSSRLREIFLKTDNYLGGRYLAELTKGELRGRQPCEENLTVGFVRTYYGSGAEQVPECRMATECLWPVCHYLSALFMRL
jgi:hypothetical protein